MKLTITNRVLLSNSLSWVLYAAVSFFAYQNIESMSETANWVNHTHEVIDNASAIEKLVLDMETGERGFLISGKNMFLKPYESGVEDLPKIFKHTRKLILDNPKQITNLNKIESLITLWQTEAAKPEIKKRQEVNQLTSTMKEVVALIEKKTGKKIMDDIRYQLQNFKLIEKALLLSRERDVAKEVKFTEYLLIFGTVFIIMFSHISSLFLADTINKPLKLLTSTIKDMGMGVFPTKIQIDSNNELADLEKYFGQIAEAQKVARE